MLLPKALETGLNPGHVSRLLRATSFNKFTQQLSISCPPQSDSCPKSKSLSNISWLTWAHIQVEGDQQYPTEGYVSVLYKGYALWSKWSEKKRNPEGTGGDEEQHNALVNSGHDRPH